MEGGNSDRWNSNTQLLEELEALSQSLYQSHTAATTRRTASLALPRTSVPSISSSNDEAAAGAKIDARPNKPRRRLSLSPWRSRPKLDDENQQRDQDRNTASTKQPEGLKRFDDKPTSAEKKGIWKWKPIRALSHIGMHKLSCLFSVEVVAAQGLPASMNGLRLSVCVRKKETKDGAVQTMPSRVSQGAADFEETLFVRCHVYCTPSNGKQMMKFEPRPFWIYLFAVDAGELDFGRSSVDLSRLIQESIDRSHEGTRVRQWDISFNLLGKAKGGELVLKLGFQIMEKDGGLGIYSQSEEGKPGKSKTLSPKFARKQSKTSFSVPSPKLSSRKEAWTPSQKEIAADLQGIDDLNLDEPSVPSSSTSIQNPPKEPDPKTEDLDLPDFEVVDKGVEYQEKEDDGAESVKSYGDRSITSEVVKEIVHDQVRLIRLTELDSIAQQIKALESMMTEEKASSKEDEGGTQKLDADEETVTREFLQMLEDEDTKGYNKFNQVQIPEMQLEGAENSKDSESEVYLPDLGKNLGCAIQTRDGGYLASMNPLDTPIARKDTPKLAMQLSKPIVLQSKQSMSGFELFQNMAAAGFEELNSKILSLMSMDDLTGKTAEQVAFEGIASAIIQGRTKEGASSSAARIIAAVKSMANAMSSGRKDRISTGIWNIRENPLTAEEILAFSMQKMESMAVEALKIQAEVAEEEAPFDVSPLNVNRVIGKDYANPLSNCVSLEDWIQNHSSNPSESITMAVGIQLRDPLRRYEAVGGPLVALIFAKVAEGEEKNEEEEEKRFKVGSLHVGGLKVKMTKGRRNEWNCEKQRLTAMQWLVEYGLVKSGKKPRHGGGGVSKGQDLLWSISSRVLADMWLKSIRNPDVKLIC